MIGYEFEQTLSLAVFSDLMVLEWSNAISKLNDQAMLMMLWISMLVKLQEARVVA